MSAYIYQTIYGVEPYLALGVPVSDEFGGGAKVTNDNLLITLWALSDLDGDIPVAGDLMKPFAFTSTGAAAIAGAAAGGINGFGNGFNPVFKSRYSTRIFIQDGETRDSPLSENMLAILQPPQDLANDMLMIARNFVSGVTPLDYTRLRSFLDVYAWSFSVTDENYLPPSVSEAAVFGGQSALLPFAQTNGADGNFPTFFDVSTPLAVAQMIEALVDGAPFFVPCVFTRSSSFDSTDTEIYTISWAGSQARR